MLIEWELVYYKFVMIIIVNEFGQCFICDFFQLCFLYSNMFYNINLSVIEFYQGVDCDVQGGYLIVNNSVVFKNFFDMFFFQLFIGDFKWYEFIGGILNLVFLYWKGINVQYFLGQGDLLVEWIILVVVIGFLLLLGSDIIVDIDEDGQVKLFVMILWDFLGDGSFSLIEEGIIIMKFLLNFFGFEFGGSVDLEIVFIVGGVGVYVDV